VKLATFQVNGAQHFGSIVGPNVVDFTSSAAVARFRVPPP
jgi:hypothetical protein